MASRRPSPRTTNNDFEGPLADYNAGQVRRDRLKLVIAGILVIAVGVVAKLAVPGFAGDLLGSACYTALLFVLVGLVAPRLPGPALALVAFAASALVEVFQLTVVPEAVEKVVPVSAWVLGSTFVPTDFVGYAAGALAAFALDFVLRSRARLEARTRRR